MFALALCNTTDITPGSAASRGGALRRLLIHSSLVLYEKRVRQAKYYDDSVRAGPGKEVVALFVDRPGAPRHEGRSLTPDTLGVTLLHISTDAVPFTCYLAVVMGPGWGRKLIMQTEALLEKVYGRQLSPMIALSALQEAVSF
jgi:hypothetical protein